MSYINVATSVLTFGASLFTPIRFAVKLWFFVNPERSLLAYAAILDPPPPHNPLKEPAFYTSTNRTRRLSQLTEFQPLHVLFIAGKRLQSVGI
jgi:hypothetical protein